MYWTNFCWFAVKAIVWPPRWQRIVQWLVVLGISGAAFQPELRSFVDGAVARYAGSTPMTSHYLLAAAVILIVALAIRIALLITPRIRLVGLEAIPGIGYTAIILIFENQSWTKLDDVIVQVRIFGPRGRVSAGGRNRYTLISSQEIAARNMWPSKAVTRHRYAIDAGDQKGFQLASILTSNVIKITEEVDTLSLPAGRYEFECKVNYGPTYRVFMVPGSDARYCTFFYRRPWHFRSVRAFAECSGLKRQIAQADHC